MRNRRGSTLIESLLALFFFLLILEASLEFFGTARAAFYKIENGLSAQEGAQAGLERIKADVLLAGVGLARPIALGLIAGIEPAADGGGVALVSLEKTALLANDARPGDSSLALGNAADFGAGKYVCLVDRRQGEIATVSAVEGNTLRLDSPLVHGYAGADTEVLLLRKVVYSLDPQKSLLKRKVNASPAQPLLEGVRSFSLDLASPSGLVTAAVVLQEKPDRAYSIAVFPKNMALARTG